MIFGLLGIVLIGLGIWLIVSPQKVIAGVVSILLGLVLIFGAWNGSRSSSCHAGSSHAIVAAAAFSTDSDLLAKGKKSGGSSTFGKLFKWSLFGGAKHC